MSCSHKFNIFILLSTVEYFNSAANAIYHDNSHVTSNHGIFSPGGDTVYRPGPHSATPAVLFGLEGSGLPLRRDARVEGHAPLAGVLGRAASAAGAAGREFALLASVRQRRSNVGTILMITDGEVARWAAHFSYQLLSKMYKVTYKLCNEHPSI